MVRMDLSTAKDIMDVLTATARQVARVYDTEDVPYEELVAALRPHADSPIDVLPRVAVTIQNFDRFQGDYGDGRITVRWNEVAERESKYDVVVTMDPVEHEWVLTAASQIYGDDAAVAVLNRIDRTLDLILTELESA